VSGTITGDAQTQLRITLAPGSTNALTILGLGFGKRDPGVPLYPNTLTTPVEALFGGLSGFAGATTPQISDWTDCSGLDLNEGDQIIVSYTTGGSGQASTIGHQCRHLLAERYILGRGRRERSRLQYTGR
jgi:hypothetical protein